MDSNKERILRVLYDNREGLGHNDLRRVPISPKSLKRWIPELISEGLITTEEVGLKRLHKITLKGIEYVERNIACERFMKRFVEFVDVHEPKEKLEMLTRLFKDLFEYAHKDFLNGKVEGFRTLFDSLSMAIMDDLNKEWLSRKEDMLKRNVFSGAYVFPEFSRNDKWSLGFIKGDAELAWDRGDYLNTHHRYILEKLDMHSKEEIENKNLEWLKKHGGQHNNFVVLEELKERIEKIRGMIKSLYPIPKEPLLYPSGKIPYRTIPNWMRNLPRDYGNSLWDIR